MNEILIGIRFLSVGGLDHSSQSGCSYYVGHRIRVNHHHQYRSSNLTPAPLPRYRGCENQRVASLAYLKFGVESLLVVPCHTYISNG